MQNIASEAPATVAIRPATLSDCPFLSKILLLASRSHLHKGFYEAMLGDDVGESEVRSMMQEWLEAEGPSYYSYEGYIIAEVNGQPAAAIRGFAFEEFNEIDRTDDIVEESLRRRNWPEERIKQCTARLSDLMCTFPCMDGEDECWGIEHVATLPQYQRRGLMDKLLTAVLQIGRERGYKKAQLTAWLGNEAAIEAYKRKGFEVYNMITSPIMQRYVATNGSITLRMEL